MASLHGEAELDAGSASSSTSLRRFSAASDESTTHTVTGTATTSEEGGYTDKSVTAPTSLGATTTTTTSAAIPFPVLLRVARQPMSTSPAVAALERTVADDTASGSEQIDDELAQNLAIASLHADKSTPPQLVRVSRFVELFDYADLVAGTRIVFVPHPQSHTLVPAYQSVQDRAPQPSSTSSEANHITASAVPVGPADDDVPAIPASVPHHQRSSSSPPPPPPRSPLRKGSMPIHSPTSSIDQVLLLSDATSTIATQQEQPEEISPISTEARPHSTTLNSAAALADKYLETVKTPLSPTASGSISHADGQLSPSLSQDIASSSSAAPSSLVASPGHSADPGVESSPIPRAQSPLSMSSTTKRKRFSLSFVDRTHTTTSAPAPSSHPMEASTSHHSSYSPTAIASSVFGRARMRARPAGTTSPGPEDHEKETPSRRASMSRFTASLQHHLSSFSLSSSSSISPPHSQLSNSPERASSPFQSMPARSKPGRGTSITSRHSQRRPLSTEGAISSHSSLSGTQSPVSPSREADVVANLSPRPAPHWSTFMQTGTGESSSAGSGSNLIPSVGRRRRRSLEVTSSSANGASATGGETVISPPSPIRSFSTPAPTTLTSPSPLPSLLNSSMRSASIAASRSSDPTVRSAAARSGRESTTLRRPGVGPRKLSKPSDAQVLREWEMKQLESAGRPRSFVSKLFAHAE